METLLAFVAGGMGGILLLVILTAIATSFLHICEPHEIVVFSGRKRVLADGSAVGYRVITGGRAFRWPVLEKAERMDARNLAIDIRTTNAYSKGGIPLSVHAVANVKISKDPMIVGNAIERFLGRDISEVHRVAKEILEGHLRGVLATLTPEEVNEDRLKFAGALVHEADDDFHRLGLQLDTLKIQAVSDEVNYLSSIGRKQIAAVLRDAEVAETTNVSDASRSQAEARRKGEVAIAASQTEIIQAENLVGKVKAELDAEARREEETTIQAARQARAEAELELQEIRRRLEELRLQADVVLPAEAEREAVALRARGNAAYTEEAGRAQAEVLNLMTTAWLKAGKDAREIFLIQNLEHVLRTVTERVGSLTIGHVNLLDGGDGQALPSHVASFPAVVGDVLEELERSTGVDVVGILTGMGRQATEGKV